MKVISELVVRVCDLMEAEGKVLLGVVQREAGKAKTSASMMALGLALLLVAVPLIVVGGLLLAGGLLWWLETVMSRGFALGVTGVVVLLMAGACVGGFWYFAEKRAR